MNTTMPERKAVRSQLFDVPEQILSWLCCSQCNTRIADVLAKDRRTKIFAVHVDHKTDEQGNKKASTYVGCSAACKDDLVSAGYVEHALTEIIEKGDDQ